MLPHPSLGWKFRDPIPATAATPLLVRHAAWDCFTPLLWSGIGGPLALAFFDKRVVSPMIKSINSGTSRAASAHPPALDPKAAGRGWSPASQARHSARRSGQDRVGREVRLDRQRNMG